MYFYTFINHKYIVMRKPYYFLLGGHDLEILEIRDMIDEAGYIHIIDFLDKGLNWGAALSTYSYNRQFHPRRINVCIELAEDIKPPKRYLRIDHHNELADRPSSIEQVAELLGVELNRWQQLVAANDKNYIPGMQAIGATPEEIVAIRRADREAQGATLEHETLAEDSIKANLRCVNVQTKAYVVRSLGDRFSCIVDRLFGSYNTLLIYSDEELTYYGEDFEKFDDLLGRVRHYNGKAFLGVGAGVLSEEEILELVEEMVGLM
jgi:hypothetical protein